MTDPGVLMVTENFGDFVKNEKIYLLAYRGEGYYDFWHKGKLHEGIPEFFGGKDLKGEIKSRPRSDWWVTVKNKEGKTGWLRLPEYGYSKFVSILNVEKRFEKNPQKTASAKFLDLFQEFKADSLFLYPETYYKNDISYALCGRMITPEAADYFGSDLVYLLFKIPLREDHILLLYRLQEDFFSYHISAIIMNIKTGRRVAELPFLAADEGCTDGGINSTSVLRKKADGKTWAIHISPTRFAGVENHENDGLMEHEEDYYKVSDSTFVEDSLIYTFSVDGEKWYRSKDALARDLPAFTERFLSSDSLCISAPDKEHENSGQAYGILLPSLFSDRFTDKKGENYFTPGSTFALCKFDIDSLNLLLVVRQKTDSAFSTCKAFVWNKNSGEISHVLNNIAGHLNSGNNFVECLIWRNRKNGLVYFNMKKFSGKKLLLSQTFHFVCQKGIVNIIE